MTIEIRNKEQEQYILNWADRNSKTWASRQPSLDYVPSSDFDPDENEGFPYYLSIHGEAMTVDFCDESNALIMSASITMEKFKYNEYRERYAIDNGESILEERVWRY